MFIKIADNKKVHAYISKTILEVLVDEELDFERIFTFSIYMQMMAIKTCLPAQTQAKVIIDDLFLYWINNYTDQNYHLHGKEEILNEGELNDLFVANKELLKEIYKNVYKNGSPGFEWLIGWERVCKESLHKTNSSFQNSIELSHVLNTHLEPSYNEMTTTIYLIKRALHQFK